MACTNCNQQTGTNIPTRTNASVKINEPEVIITKDKPTSLTRITWKGKFSDYSLYVENEENIYKIVKDGDTYTALVKGGIIWL